MSCKKCTGGIVSAKKEGYAYVFKCPCNKSNISYPDWSDLLHLNGYTVEDADETARRVEEEAKNLIRLGSKSYEFQNAPAYLKKKAIEIFRSGWRPELQEIKSALEIFPGTEVVSQKKT